MTMEILKEAKKRFGNKVDVVIYGLDQKELHHYGLEKRFDFRNLGLLNSIQVSRLFNESDVFVDFSVFQAMGLAAMEAMSSGLAVIVPKSGGATSFAKDGANSLVVDTSNKESCKKALFELIENVSLREKLGRQALNDMPKYHSDFCAEKMAKILFD
jgi:glycosyltransferase involved in cell wall biosynthesis